MKPPEPRPEPWPYRADPPGRYWGAYHVYQERGGELRLRDDISGFVSGGENEGDISRFYFFCVAFDQLRKEHITGDFAELGVYKGHTASLLAKMARRMGTTAWLLDTFEGFNAADFTGPDAAERVRFTDTSLEAVRKLVGEDNVRYVPGYFPESAAQMPDDLKFALVHIDCDLYSPISNALRYFYPRVLPGGYLIVHDYASLAWAGAEQAVDQFFADKPEAVIPLTDGGGSAVVRKSRVGGAKHGWLAARRRLLVSSEWKQAGNGGVRELLGPGWSGNEPWGVWGIGPSHRLRLYFADPPAGDVVAEFRGGAALAGTRETQEVAVCIGDARIATWTFTRDKNSAERTAIIPGNLVTDSDEGPMVEIEFRPASIAPLNELDPSSKDDRALGMSLVELRVRL
jgi:hypothetical protein